MSEAASPVTQSRGKTVLVASLSSIRDDGRILRQIRALVASGYSVVAFGAPSGWVGEARDFAGVTFVDLDLPDWSLALKARATLGFAWQGLFTNENDPDLGAGSYRGLSTLRSALLAWADAHDMSDVSLAIAHDWPALPAVLALKARHAIAFHYDSHEFATQEFSDNRLWSLAYPRLIRQIEQRGAAAARSISAPSLGICDALRESYSTPAPIERIRNVNEGEPLAPRPTAGQVHVLYHGIFRPDRGLIDMLDGLSRWPDRFDLTLRGHATSQRFGALIACKAAEHPGRVMLAPLVPPDRILAEAAKADIGVFLPPLTSPQLRHALPNKLFEYLHAGLMVIVPEGCEMGDLVRQTGAGLVIDPSKTALASVLATLDPATIDRHKDAAFRAASTLGWTEEAQKFLRLTGLT